MRKDVKRQRKMIRKININLIPAHYQKRFMKAETEEEKQEVRKELCVRNIFINSLLDWSNHEITGFGNQKKKHD